MTLQWTAVAFFLYAEIVVNLILCIPFVSPRRWRSVFGWRLWSWLTPYWNKCFFTMIMVLVILFLDAVREVQKYSGPQPMHDAKTNPNVYDHVHMKLFRAQRNLYICGFSLFLWLLVQFIMRRVITLINQSAATLEDLGGLQLQVERAAKAAKQHLEDNLMLKQALIDEEKSVLAKNQTMKQQVDKLTGQLKAAEDAVTKSQAEVEAMRRQAKGLAQEYDRLLREHNRLQNLPSTEDKKDQ